MVIVILMGVTALVAESAAGDSLAEIAASGDWTRVLAIATVRREQLPLRPDEALVAAHAARRLDDPVAERRFLELAMSDGPLAVVAAIELAELVVGDDGARAVDAALPVLIAPPTRQLGAAAAVVLERAYGGDLDGDRRARVRAALDRVRGERVRSLAATVARTDDDPVRLAALLRASNRDLAALAAADALADRPDLTPDVRWRIATTWYRHARYQLAAPAFEALLAVEDRAVPRREVAFLRGRCAFRLGRWPEAVAWYERALELARTGEQRADLLVHLGRTWELAGELDRALELARQAVLARASDERRLLLARLRLRRGEPDLAALGVGRTRSRSSRDHGALLIGLDELRRGEMAAARARLGAIRRAPWAGPAAVLAAGLDVAADRPEAAFAVLEATSRRFDWYWGGQARALLARLPASVLDTWRERVSLQATVGTGAEPRRALATWAALEPDPARLAAIRALAAASGGLGTPPQGPPQHGLAGALWQVGLSDAALRWDPGSLPTRDAADALWTARELLKLGMPWDAIRIADHAWRSGGGDLPLAAHPTALSEALLPLPDAPAVHAAAAAAGVPWSLVAAVAREESRWRPDAVSAVGARGLMQLMPATAAAAVATRLAIDAAPDDLFDAALNLRLGAAELARLTAVFGGHRAAAVAAYNAGEDQARLWLAQCGGCDEARYVAGISFTATRVYTADVLAAASAYDELFAPPPASPGPATSVE